MKYLITVLAFIGLQAFSTNNKKTGIHQFSIKSIEGKKIDFSSFKGKKILIVNTASACGYTKQYAALQKLYTDYKDKLVVVGFPCNQFGAQESGTEQEIKQFCTARFGVTFPLTTKIDVKGDNQNNIYKWLCNKSENGVLDATIQWNFNKFLIDENGKLLAYFPSKVTPDSEEITKFLK
jgi:glutathione peroxidase